jgi:hypothetical protein
LMFWLEFLVILRYNILNYRAISNFSSCKRDS